MPAIFLYGFFNEKGNSMEGKSQEAEEQLRQKEEDLHRLQESCQGNTARWEELQSTAQVQQLVADIANLKRLLGKGYSEKFAPNDPVACSLAFATLLERLTSGYVGEHQKPKKCLARMLQMRLPSTKIAASFAAFMLPISIRILSQKLFR